MEEPPMEYRPGRCSATDLEKDHFDVGLAESLNQLFRRLRLLYFILAGIVILALLAVISAVVWPIRAHTTDLIDPASLQTQLQCGASTKEAQALGCKFDILAMAWLPPACVDPGLTTEFRSYEKWRYWADEQATVELREDELWNRSGPDGVVWAPLKWHLVHCNFQWQKMNRAMLVGRRIEAALADLAHTKHCGNIVLDRSGLDELRTEITIAFLTC